MPGRASARALVVIFVLMLALPLLATLGGIGTGRAAGETGESSEAPHGWWKPLDAFDGRFAFRSMLIHAHAVASVWLHASPSPAVIRGRDGWLFYADDSALEDYISAAPMSQADLDAWRQSLLTTRDALRARGIAFVFAIAPDKHVIYPEYLPSSVHRVGAEYRLQQLTAYLRSTTDLTVVDWRQPLLAAKPKTQVYYRTDTHWNDAGAEIAYETLLDAAHIQLPALTPARRCDFSSADRDGPGRDLAEMLGLATRLPERVTDLQPKHGWQARVVEPTSMREGFEVADVVTTRDDAALPRLLMFRDSFGSGLIRFLSEHFSRARYLWQPNVDLDIVDAEKPALVIQEMVGRRLQTYVP